MRKLLLSLFGLIGSIQIIAQAPIDLFNKANVEPINSKVEKTQFKGVDCLKVIDAGENTELKIAKLSSTSLRNGIIEVELVGMPMAGSSEQARGFVGISFRIKQDNSAFECFYLRPTNGRADDQVRRNHSAQYISYPDYPWFRSRKETTEKYESYVDLVPGEWTKVKIVIEGEKARLYVHDAEQPTLIVNDLKLGAGESGSIGLWIGPGTEAYFANLRVTEK